MLMKQNVNNDVTKDSPIIEGASIYISKQEAVLTA